MIEIFEYTPVRNDGAALAVVSCAFMRAAASTFHEGSLVVEVDEPDQQQMIEVIQLPAENKTLLLPEPKGEAIVQQPETQQSKQQDLPLVRQAEDRLNTIEIDSKNGVIFSTKARKNGAFRVSHSRGSDRQSSKELLKAFRG